MARFRKDPGWLRRGQEAMKAVKGRRQAWWCEQCDVGGAVAYPVGAGVYEVLTLIGDAHRDMSPACAEDWGRTRVRVDATTVAS